MEEKKYLQRTDLSAYQMSFELSNYVWKLVLPWDFFAKDTIGKQYVRAVDSISANIAEGFGRFSKKDKTNFYRYAYGSIQESLDWTEKALIRNLLTSEQYQKIYEDLKQLPKELHGLIKFTNERLSL